MVKQQAVEHAVTFLQELPEKPKEDLSLKEAVESLRDPIKSALAKGYSYQDLADLLSEKGIKISALTLKNYVPAGKRQTGKTKGRKPRKAQENEVATAEAALPQAVTETTSPATPETEAPPAKPRRGRAKGTVAAKTQTERQTRATQPTTKAASSSKAAKAPSTRRRKTSA